MKPKMSARSNRITEILGNAGEDFPLQLQVWMDESASLPVVRSEGFEDEGDGP